MYTDSKAYRTTAGHKRIAALITALAMLCCMLPTSALAIASDTPSAFLCGHVHDESCGFAAGSDGTPCKHVHDDACYATVQQCTHTHDDVCGYSADGGCTYTHVHDENCGYDAETGAGCTDVHVHGESCGTACTHVCDSGCSVTALSCNHTHDALCGYSEPVPGAPCSHICNILSFSGQTPGTAIGTYQAAAGQSFASICAALPETLPGTLACAGDAPIPVRWTCGGFADEAGMYTFRAELVNERCTYTAADDPQTKDTDESELPFITVAVPEQLSEVVPLCTCTDACTDELVNTDCPACAKDHTACGGVPQTEQAVPVCTCNDACSDEHINSDCPVCAADHAVCEGIAQIDDTLPVFDLQERELEKAAEDGAVIKVSGLLPTTAELRVDTVPNDAAAEFAPEGSEVLFAYDIKLTVPATPTDATPTDAPAEMTEYQPTVPVSVSITPPADTPIETPVDVTHVDADNNAALVAAETVDGAIQFTADGFSVYVVTMGTNTPRVTFNYDDTALDVEYCTTIDGTYAALSGDVTVATGTDLYFTVTGSASIYAWRDGEPITADGNGIYTIDEINSNTAITIGADVTLDITFGSIDIGGDDGSGGRNYTYSDANGSYSYPHLASNVYTITGSIGNAVSGGEHNLTLTGAGDFNVILSDVTIYTGAPGGDYVGSGICAPVSTNDVTGDGNINITLVGENHLDNVSGNAASSYAALEKNNTASTLIIGGSGTLYATGGSDSAGIGSSNNVTGGNGGTRNIVINGGSIVATTHGSQGAGIGSGDNKNAENIRIYGGNITATCGNNGAGIGGSGSVSFIAGYGEVYIYGGTITAISDGAGAGIGGGGSLDSNKSTGGIGRVHIYGGDITTSSIGGGAGAASGGTATVSISGGKVTATGSIGGGDSSDGSGGTANITISGGTISAANISGGHGAGGAHSGGSLTVTGGSANVSHVCPAITPKDSGGSTLVLYKIYVANGGAAVSNARVSAVSLDPSHSYNLNDVYTDSGGYLYFWLPSGTTVETVTATVNGSPTPCDTSTTQASASISPAANAGYIDFEQELTAVLSQGTATAWRWEKLSGGVWSAISGANTSTFSPTVYDVGEVRVVINDTYTSASVFIRPPTISATVPLNVTVVVDANGDFTVPSSTAYQITNNSAVDLYLTDVTLAWDAVNASTVFADYTKLGAALTLGSAYSFGGDILTHAIPAANGKINKTNGTLPLAWSFSLNREGTSGNYLRSTQTVQFAHVTYTVSYIAPA